MKYNDILLNKKINININGKDGSVIATSLQKHLPYESMRLFVTETNHMLFCQKDHPMIIMRDNNILELEAKDVDVDDKLYIDNTFIKNKNNISNLYSAKIVPPILKKFNDTLDKDLLKKCKIINGDVNTYRLEPDFINYPVEWIVEFLDSFIYINNENKFKIRSYNFLQQLKMMCDKVGYDFELDFVRDGEPVYFFVRINKNTSNKLIKGYSKIKKIYIIKNWKSFVYDVKTNTQEFMLGAVQNHNSFHCFSGDMTVQLLSGKNGNETISFKDLWEQNKDNIIYRSIHNGVEQEEIFLDDILVLDNLKFTKAIKIIRHKRYKYSKMVRMSLDNGAYIVSQDNHPHMLCIRDDKFEQIEPKDIKNYNDYQAYYFYSILNTYCVKIQKIEEIDFDDSEYVYDLTTESGTLFVNNIWTHNTGGAVELIKVNIINELMTNLDEKYRSALNVFFTQKEKYLYLNEDVMSISVDKTIYTGKYKIIDESDRYKLPLGYFKININNIEIEVTIEQPVELYKYTDYKETDNNILLMYGKDDKVMKVEPFILKPEKIAGSLDQYLGGQSPYTTPESLLLKLYRILSNFDSWDMVHLETIVSSILRNKQNPQIPARLKEPYDPVTVSVKNLPSILSPYLGISFENISKSLTSSLISDEPPYVSPIEKVLFGVPLSDLNSTDKKK